MTALLHAHSGLRYLVLLAGLAALVVFGLGVAQKKPFDKPGRIIGSIFAGLTHLQVVLGIVLVAMGTWYPALIGHLVCMLSAAVVLQVLLIRNRKSASPGFSLPLIAVIITLLLMVAGTFAINRHPFQSTLTGG